MHGTNDVHLLRRDLECSICQERIDGLAIGTLAEHRDGLERLVLSRTESLRRSQSDIERISARLQAAIDSTNNGFLVEDGEGHISVVNDLFLSLSGLTREQASAMSAGDLLATFGDPKWSVTGGGIEAWRDKISRDETIDAEAGRAEAADVVLQLVRERSAQRVLLGDGAFVDSLDLARTLTDAGIAVVSPGDSKEALFAADIGITGVDHVIAETGTLVMRTRPEQPRAASLLPPVHIAVAHKSQIVADLFDVFGKEEMPACLTLITGPSKTGDIELRLVTGVHGPGEIHVVLVNPSV